MSALATGGTVLLLLLFLLLLLLRWRNRRHSKTCSGAGHGCSSIDPVNEPWYNMIACIKQSVLVEDHLVEKKKRCNVCIAKHLLTLVALAEEAQSLAGARKDQYPLLPDSAEFYDTIFKEWQAHRDDDETLLAVADALRARRRDLIKAYVLK